MPGREAFDETGTLGVEEEYFVVDAETHEPVPASDILIDDADIPAELEGHVGTELFKFVFETTTDKTETLEGAREEMERKRNALVEHARDHGYEVLSAGLHPSARWDKHEHAEGPRYRQQLDRIRYPQHRNITAGLHVHVGVDGADKAVYVADEVRRYLPLLLALSANSPFWYGRDTGLASARAVVFENLPNTGVPSRFGDWDTFRSFERRMVESDSVADRGEIWWDVRPHTEYGTVEIRSPDSQASLGRAFAFVALCRALVLELASQYGDAEPTKPRRELLNENKWRACRYGQKASFMLHDGGTAKLEDRFDDVLEAVETPYEDEIRALTDRSGAERQREAYENGGMDAVLESIVLED
ncbi:MAG: glutamate--cysteine ligase [Halobacteriales archaeon]|nr:glutamate--cysteine ligase [Halobacteriales archaeon]